MFFQRAGICFKTLYGVSVGFRAAYKADLFAAVIGYEVLDAVDKTAFVVKANGGISFYLAGNSNYRNVAHCLEESPLFFIGHTAAYSSDKDEEHVDIFGKSV